MPPHCRVQPGEKGCAEVAKYIIEGGRKLHGEISLQGAKNAILPILAAALVSQRPVHLYNCPCIGDVDCMLDILRSIGSQVSQDGQIIHIDSKTARSFDIPDDSVRQVRSSIVFLGAVLARFGRAIITYPGGCEIGLRPIDLHLKSLRRMGVEIEEGKGRLHCICRDLKGAMINLDYPSVGATENIMLTALNARGRTIIQNAAREPEIKDLADAINGMGGNVRGAGSPTILIEGGASWREMDHNIIPDRIAAGTFISCVASAGGEVLIRNVCPAHLEAVLSKFEEAGCEIESTADTIAVKRQQRLKAVERVGTMPYPGFPTDMQAQFSAILAQAEGTSIVTENIFENRFKHVSQLRKMGANIAVEGRTAIIQGGSLRGSRVEAGDLRGGAALCVAGLGASGTTIVEKIEFIRRGYQDLAGTLRGIGASIAVQET